MSFASVRQQQEVGRGGLVPVDQQQQKSGEGEHMHGAQVLWQGLGPVALTGQDSVDVGCTQIGMGEVGVLRS